MRKVVAKVAQSGAQNAPKSVWGYSITDLLWKGSTLQKHDRRGPTASRQPFWRFCEKASPENIQSNICSQRP